MCFSAGASFASGIIISSVGIATIKKIQNPKQIVFASIPLILGIHQIVEGFLWLALQYPTFSEIQKLSSYLFLIIAQIIWPLLMPISVLAMENNLAKKKLLCVLRRNSWRIFCIRVLTRRLNEM